MHPAHRRIDIHEYAVWLWRCASRRWFYASPHLEQPALAFLRIVDIPCSIEGREGAGLVLREHLFRSDGEDDVRRAGFHIVDGQMERRARAGTGILYVDHVQTLQTGRTKCELTADHVLALHVALRRDAEGSPLELS